jgi:hypothetical protein
MLKRMFGKTEAPFQYVDPPDPVSDFPQLAAFWQTTEVSGGGFFIDDLFQRKYASDTPGFGHHWVSFYRSNNGEYSPVNYIHAREYGPMVLIGGVMTDGMAVKKMSEEHREALIEAGGFYYVALRTVFAIMADQCEAFMGYIGDARSHEVSTAAGFRDTKHPHLVARFHPAVSSSRQAELIQIAHELDAF